MRTEIQIGDAIAQHALEQSIADLILLIEIILQDSPKPFPEAAPRSSALLKRLVGDVGELRNASRRAVVRARQSPLLLLISVPIGEKGYELGTLRMGRDRDRKDKSCEKQKAHRSGRTSPESTR